MTFEIKEMHGADIHSVKDIELESSLSPWTKKAYLDELLRKTSICRVAVEGKYETGSDAIGFLIGRVYLEVNSMKKTDTSLNPLINSSGFFEVLNIGVRETSRNCGVGSALLRSAIERARNFGVNTILLEVRESNLAAICFYEGQGFKTIYRRKSLYCDPNEDGLGMKMSLV